LEIRNLPATYRSFVGLVEENPSGEGENFVLWARRILRLCRERQIEYPKVFLKRFKDAERALEDQNDPYGEIAHIPTLEAREADMRKKYGHLMKD